MGKARLWNYDTNDCLREATADEIERSLLAVPTGAIDVDGVTCYVLGGHTLSSLCDLLLPRVEIEYLTACADMLGTMLDNNPELTAQEAFDAI